MRDQINVLYYPDFWLDSRTLKKAILLFDELHFMDRPSMMFGIGHGQFGTVGAASPIRQYEVSFRSEGVPLYVHEAPNGPVHGEWYEDIKADVNDPEFLARFQDGLRTSPMFRDLQITPGNYGEFGDEKNVAKLVTGVNLGAGIGTHESPIALFEDSSVRPFDLSRPVGCAKQLIAMAVTCSAKLNFALKAGVGRGFVPLADTKPYGDLLGAKYQRAINALQPAKNNIQITDLSFAIFDELVPAESVGRINISDAIRYRKQSQNAREEFLEHLGDIQRRQANVSVDGDYSGTIEKLIDTEIKPAVHNFRSRLLAIEDSFYGALAKGTIGAVSGSSVITLFGDLSWQKLLALASGAASFIVKAGIDAILAERAARRECSMSYLLSLDEFE